MAGTCIMRKGSNDADLLYNILFMKDTTENFEDYLINFS
jgi:hypothetical protein